MGKIKGRYDTEKMTTEKMRKISETFEKTTTVVVIQNLYIEYLTSLLKPYFESVAINLETANIVSLVAMGMFTGKNHIIRYPSELMQAIHDEEIAQKKTKIKRG